MTCQRSRLLGLSLRGRNMDGSRGKQAEDRCARDVVLATSPARVMDRKTDEPLNPARNWNEKEAIDDRPKQDPKILWPRYQVQQYGDHPRARKSQWCQRQRKITYAVD